MVPVYKIVVGISVVVMTLVEVKVAIVSTTLKVISMHSDRKWTKRC
jgi:hypothetical protein